MKQQLMKMIEELDSPFCPGLHRLRTECELRGVEWRCNRRLLFQDGDMAEKDPDQLSFDRLSDYWLHRAGNLQIICAGCNFKKQHNFGNTHVWKCPADSEGCGF